MSVLEVEIYGGVLLNSWLDRDLGLAGVVHAGDGASRLCETRRPMARVPQLAIHLDREVNEKGLVLHPQNHMRPIWGSEGGDVLDLLGIGPGDTFEIALFDVTPAALVGSGEEFIAAGRIDNLVSCWAAVDAIRHIETDRPVIVCLFDHEEVGSESTTGAGGPLLEHVVDELLRVRGLGDNRFDFLRKSICISADNAHGLHPNYPERHDANHAPLVNRGPALKQNANQRYATSAKGAAIMRRVAAEAAVPLQSFVSNNSMPCGSTIGPVTATRMGIETVDVGVPQLAMHSARETCGASDPIALRDLMIATAKTSAY
jgi:aspartyl aminopeptidase